MKDIQRAAAMIGALPFMSKTIVDDTLYEKVLSFLTLVLSTHTTEAIVALDEQCHIFAQIKQACLIDKQQDYRVISLCIRLMGQLVRYGKDAFFDQLQCDDYASLLGMVTSGIKSSEAALRCACIEACRWFVTCDKGYAWLLSNQGATSLITFALLDQSSYVVAEACQLFAVVLRLDSDTLLKAIDPSGLVLSLLQQYKGGDQRQRLSALDFCWAVVDLQDPSTLTYLRSKQLLHSLIPSLLLSERMIRSRTLEVLCKLFSWDNDPLQTLGLSKETSDVGKAYEVISELAIDVMRTCERLDDIMTGVSLLDASFSLLGRQPETRSNLSDAAYNALQQTLSICLGREGEALPNIRKALPSTRSKNNLLQLVIRSLNTLVEANPVVTEKSDFHGFSDVLLQESLYSDSRVLKATLLLLTSTLYNTTASDQQSIILTQCTDALVNIMMSDDMMDCKSLCIVLESFDTLLSHESIGSRVTESGKALAQALSFKLLDTEWDIRDAAINFVGQLFSEPTVSNKVQFALMYGLPIEVFHRIHDSEPYVRASAVHVLQMMMRCREGWDYIQQHKVSRDLAAKLPSLLYDTEAFVRRATLDAISCLVQNRSCQGMLMETQDADNQNSLNPEILRKLMNDEDTDVRIKSCRLIYDLWQLYIHEKEQNKRDSGQSHDTVAFFQHIHAGDLLAESAVDTNRVVRIEAVSVIEAILNKYESSSSLQSKRMLDEEDDIVEKLRTVNLDQQKQTLDPEHLYQEAFDVNADMMTQSIIPTNPDDDMNMLDCY